MVCESWTEVDGRRYWCEQAGAHAECEARVSVARIPVGCVMAMAGEGICGEYTEGELTVRWRHG